MTKLNLESKASKAKRISNEHKPKLKNLSKEELGELLLALMERIEELEAKQNV